MSPQKESCKSKKRRRCLYTNKESLNTYKLIRFLNAWKYNDTRLREQERNWRLHISGLLWSLLLSWKKTLFKINWWNRERLPQEEILNVSYKFLLGEFLTMWSFSQRWNHFKICSSWHKTTWLFFGDTWKCLLVGVKLGLVGWERHSCFTASGKAKPRNILASSCLLDRKSGESLLQGITRVVSHVWVSSCGTSSRRKPRGGYQVGHSIVPLT